MSFALPIFFVFSNALFNHSSLFIRISSIISFFFNYIIL